MMFLSPSQKNKKRQLELIWSFILKVIKRCSRILKQDNLIRFSHNKNHSFVKQSGRSVPQKGGRQVRKKW